MELPCIHSPCKYATYTKDLLTSNIFMLKWPIFLVHPSAPAFNKALIKSFRDTLCSLPSSSGTYSAPQ